jgi:2-iminoacetate synthase ThiH
MARVRVDVEEVLKLRARMDEINSHALKNVDFYHKGKKVKISAEDINDWKYTGLSTMFFVETVIKDEYLLGLTVIRDECGNPIAVQG